MYSPQLLYWEDNLTTGDRELDSQHRYLFEICNDLATAIEKERGRKIIGMVLEVLVFYANSHFKKEEACMERHRCIVAARNQKAHAVFIEQLKSFRAEHRTTDDPEAFAVKIHRFLTDWIVQHIMNVDTHLYTAIHHKPRPDRSS